LCCRPDPTDASLVAAFAAGSRDAGDRLFSRYAGDLRRFLLIRTRDADLADELMQEVAARLVTASSRLDPDRNTRAYVFRAARNAWIDYLRREMTRRRGDALLANEGNPMAPAADAQVLERDLAAAVRRAIVRLPAAQRQVVELRMATGSTFREIAQKLKRPLGSVLRQMHTALKAIAKATEAYR
jgi:RNA polymerase sigma-70 factor (ECF subfamily)